MTDPTPPLAGLTGIVTGAARGIGRAIAERLAADGARLALVDLDAAGAADAAAALPTVIDGPHVGLPHDLAQLDRASIVADQAVAALGRVDILVNNAGVGTMGAFLDMPPETFEQVVKVNLVGTFALTQAVARTMVPRRFGRIVTITSISGHRGGRDRAAYGASKAGLDLLTRVMALELGEHGITANAVAPGPVDTALTQAAHTEDIRRNFHRLIPLRRYGETAEIAGAVAYLVRPDSGYTNGQTLSVDGGFDAVGLGVVPE